MSQNRTVRLLISHEHACGYLPRRKARSAFIDPQLKLNAKRYGQLLSQGFRRSGSYVYRPLCRGCAACRPARVVVADFQPDRSQRRCLRDNADLELRAVDRLNDEHYTLYRNYLRTRHPDGEMDPNDSAAFHEFLASPWLQTLFLEFRAAQRLVAVAVVDQIPNGLSAVYTFFDPHEKHRGLGNYAILKQIELARDTGLDYLYLGYWVPGSPKMDYKRRFKPIQLLDARGWHRYATLTHPTPTPAV